MDFVDKRKKDKLGLTIFADFAYVAVPLTYDKKSINSILEKINVGIAGVSRTALYEALFMSSKLFKNSKSKNKIAILLTDGVDNADSIPLKVAINTSKEYGIKVYTIGVGREGYDFNSNVLKKISEETGGKYFSATSNQDLIDIYKNIDKLEKSEIKSNKYIQKTYYFQYVLFLLVLLFASLFILKNRS
jgi:Ca-activated chloride channel family protein